MGTYLAFGGVGGWLHGLLWLCGCGLTGVTALFDLVIVVEGVVASRWGGLSVI